jgi:hypothetical protein
MRAGTVFCVFTGCYQLQRELLSIESNGQDYSEQQRVEEEGIVAYFTVLSQNSYEKRKRHQENVKTVFCIMTKQRCSFLNSWNKCKIRSFKCFRRFRLRHADVSLQFVLESEKLQEDVGEWKRLISRVSRGYFVLSQILLNSRTIRDTANR